MLLTKWLPTNLLLAQGASQSCISCYAMLWPCIMSSRFCLGICDFSTALPRDIAAQLLLKPELLREPFDPSVGEIAKVFLPVLVIKRVLKTQIFY
jgi:hypothetical protein